MLSTIYISSGSIKLMTVKRNAVSKWAVRSLEPGLVRDGKILDPLKLGQAIDNLFQSLSVPRNKVIITVSGLPYTYRLMNLPKMKPEQVKAAMNYNVPNEFTVPAESLYISWAPLSAQGNSVEYFVIGVNRQIVDAIIETVNFASITDWSLDIRPLALARAAAQTDAVVVSLDYDYMDMVLVRGGKVRELHSASVEMDAEDFNRENYLRLFATEISKLISYHYSNDKNANPGNIPIVLTGETVSSLLEKSDKESVLQELSNAAGYPAELLKIAMPYPKDFAAEPYAVNIGLALSKRKGKPKAMNGFHDISLDLLRGEFVKKPQTLSFSYIVYPALLVMIIGVIAAYTSANHQIKADVADLQDQLDRANQNLVAVRSAQEKAAEIQKQLDTATTQLQTLRDEHRQILGNKGDYAPYLNQITSALPAEATFDTINISGNSIRVTGMVNDPFDVVTYFRSLETAGFSGLNIYYIGDPDINNQYPFTMIINLEESSNDNGVE